MAHSWTAEEMQFLQEYAPGHHYIEIETEIERRFGWKPSRSQLKNRLQCSGIRLNVAPSGRFQPGHEPFSKGTKGLLKKNSGSFQKGNMPKNHRPVGSTRVVQGYHETKVAEPNVWKQTHRLVWEEAHGLVPDGCMVVFKDQDHSNLKLNNLMLISRAQNVRMNQNGLFSADPEVTEAGANLAELMCSISAAQKRGDGSGRKRKAKRGPAHPPGVSSEVPQVPEPGEAAPGAEADD